MYNIVTIERKFASGGNECGRKMRYNFEFPYFL